MNTSPQGASKAQTILHLFEASGLNADDFEIEECDGQGSVNLLGLDGGIILIRRVSTGQERLYATGPGSAWFGSIFMDLGWGHFGSTALVLPASHA